jgi:hypothetical protein
MVTPRKIRENSIMIPRFNMSALLRASAACRGDDEKGAHENIARVAHH